MKRPAAHFEDVMDSNDNEKKAKLSLNAGIGMTWGTPNKEPVRQPRPGESVIAPLTYQGDKVPRGVVASGKVRTHRDGSGSDGAYFGCDFVRRDIPVTNGRGMKFELDEHGFAFVDDERPELLDFKTEENVLQKYYPDCCELVKRITGAAEVYAFDHNVRSKALSDAKQKIEGGNAVQGPAFVVHNDYTSVSAPRRVRDLADPPKANDTLRKILGEQPLLDPNRIEELMQKRWALINVWRNIRRTPVQKMPLAMCDGRSLPKEDIITFEIHYVDRVGENYFAGTGKSSNHQWYYFPEATHDEAILLKVWDSAGETFADPSVKDRVPATCSFHSAFEDPSSAPDAEDRESIEVRTVVFY